MPNSFSISKALAVYSISIDDIESSALVNDSRVVNEDSVFCAVIGSQQDGRQYIDKAIENGAKLIVSECQHKQQHGHVVSRVNKLGVSIQIVQFYQLNNYLTELAQHYYGNPLKHLSLIGVTGTNGKTSTCFITAKLLEICHKSSAIIGTIGAGKLSSLSAINNTTPGATELNQLLASFVSQNIEYVAMEVSSHALEQRRLTAEMLDVAVYCNLSRDHLDYHQTMEKYAEAKRLIFAKSNQVAVLNGDDAVAKEWLSNWQLTDNVIVFGKDNDVTHFPKFIQASDIKLSTHGLSFTITTEIESQFIECGLLGEFNVENLLAAIAVLISQKIALSEICQAIKVLTPINGRMESFTDNNKATSVVDYAHTPEALENALIACRRHCEGELWVVFGCGGNRDKGKRSLMGQIAEQHADHIVLTNDNPRNETPEMIVTDILAGCAHREKIAVILDRKQAVTNTVAHAQPGDVVLLAGKGHEETIEIGDEIIYYSERELVKTLYQQSSEETNVQQGVQQ